MSLPLTSVGNSGCYFLLYFSSMQKELERIVETETQEEPLQGMFTTDDRRRNVFDRMRGNKHLQVN